MNSAPAVPGDYQSFKTVLPGLLYLAVIFLTNFFSRIIFAPFLPVIEGELGLSHAGSGSFFLFISAGYFISILSSGFVSSRISHKTTIIVSTIGNGVFLCLLSFCGSLLSLRLGLLCLGLSAGLYLPSGLSAVSRLVSPGYLARGMAIHELAPNIGFILVPMISAILLRHLSWSRSLLVTGGMFICIGIAYGFSRSPDFGFGQRPDFTSCRKILCCRPFWLMVLMFTLAISATLGIYTMLPLFLVAGQDIDLTQANNVLALSRVSTIVMPLLGGWAGDRFNHRTVILFVLISSGLLTIPIGFTGGSLLLFFIFLQPMVAVCFFPSAFSVLTKLGGSGDGSLVISLCIPLAFLAGGGAVPALIGLVGDYYSLAVGITLVGGAVCCGGVLTALYWKEDRVLDVESRRV